MPIAEFSMANASPAAWHLDEPKKNATGQGFNVNVGTVAHGGPDDKPTFQLIEAMQVPFGLEDGPEAKSRKKMELSIGRDSPIIQVAQRIDEFVVQYTTRKSVEFFKKQMTEDQVRTLFRPTVTLPEDPTRRALMRVKVNAEESKRPTNVLVALNERQYAQGKLADIQQGCSMKVIFEIGGIWYAAKSFGVTLVAKNVLVYASKRGVCAGIDDFSLPAGMELVSAAAALPPPAPPAAAPPRAAAASGGAVEDEEMSS